MSGSFPWERLSAADVSNLAFEREGQAYTVALAATLEAAPLLAADGGLDLARLRRLLRPRVEAVPRLCRRVLPTRWGQGWPVWVDCQVDLDVHVRAEPAVHGTAEFEERCAELLRRPLRRDRPLWDLAVMPGPSPTEVALLLRVHHALADGVAAVALLGGLFDPADGAPSDRSAVRVGRAPTGRELVAEAWSTRWSRLVGGLRRARRWPAAARAVGRGAVRTAAVARRGIGPTSLLGPVGTHRRIVFSRATLDAVGATAHAADATVNDVLLKAVADATAALLAARGEPVPDELPVSVPVSLRGREGVGPGDRTGNRTGVMLVRLPLHGADDATRLRRIAASTRAAKQAARAAGTLELTRSRLGIRVMDVLSRHQHTVALFVTNVPGPTQPLRLAGARLLHAWPVSLIAGNVRIGVAALSYAGEFGVTTTVDAASCPDAGVFTRQLQAALDGAEVDGVGRTGA